MARNRSPMVIETMTLKQVTDAFRGLGVRTSEERVARMLEAGAYPWGVCVQGRKERIVEIYAKKFWEWVDDVGIADTTYLEAQKSSPAAGTTGLRPARRPRLEAR